MNHCENCYNINYVDFSLQVYTWGKGYCGALGHGDEIDKTIPQPLNSLRSQLAVQVWILNQICLAFLCGFAFVVSFQEFMK